MKRSPRPTRRVHSRASRSRSRPPPRRVLTGSRWSGAVRGERRRPDFWCRTDWPQFGFNARRTRYNPFENVLGPSNVARLGVAWSFTTGDAVARRRRWRAGWCTSTTAPWSARCMRLMPPPATSCGPTHTGGSPTRRRRWRTGWCTSALRARRGVCARASTGRKLWSIHQRHHRLVADGGGRGGVRRLGGRQGCMRFGPPPAASCGPTPPAHVVSSPAVAGGVVYIGSARRQGVRARCLHRPQAVVLHHRRRVSTRRRRWRTGWCTSARTTTRCMRSMPPPAASCGPTHRRLSARRRRWPTAWCTSARTTARCMRSTRPPATSCGPTTPATGSSARRRRWPTGWCTSARTTDNVYALDASTGQKLWSYTTGDDGHSSPAVANGEVYVGSNDGKLYAFDLTANPTNRRRPGLQHRG